MVVVALFRVVGGWIIRLGAITNFRHHTQQRLPVEPVPVSVIDLSFAVEEKESESNLHTDDSIYSLPPSVPASLWGAERG